MTDPIIAEEIIARALRECASEPIHIPGAIQPEGMLLVISADERQVVQVSANAAEWLGLAALDLLGRPLARVLPMIAGMLDGMVATGIAGLPLPLPLHLTTPGGRPLIAHVHQVERRLVIEVTPADEANVGREGMGIIARLLAEQGAAAGSTVVATLAEPIVRAVADLSGYDRVMIYRFDAQGNGEVVAESVRPGVEAFLGLHYPASDIPTQARAVLLRNRVRVISDSRHVPVALMTLDGESRIDLTATQLRAVSPVHLEYLRNMQVGASMTVSIVVDGALWGLIACHQRTPRGASAWLRSQIDLVASLFAARLAERDSRRHLDAQVRADRLQRELLQHLTLDDSVGWASQLIADPSLLSLVGASGAVIAVEGHRLTAGQVPSDAVIDAIIAWVRAQPPQSVLSTNHLGNQVEAALPARQSCSGILAIALHGGGHLLWLRAEHVSEVTWGGDPTKPVIQDGGSVRLSPRTSFSAWVQTVYGHCRPWSVEDLAAAKAIQQHLANVVAHVYGVKGMLTRSNRELRDFAHAVSHDLREPCRTIRTFCEIALMQGGDQLPANIAQRISRVVEVSSRMQRLITDLLAYAEVEHSVDSSARIDVREAVDEAMLALAAAVTDAGATITIDPLPIITGNHRQIIQLFQNLIGNAIKYRGERPPMIHISAQRQPGAWCLRVRDNGQGIPKEYQESIFGIFKRLHSVETGSGVGLALCRRVAELHGGRIWVDSEPGNGSTFHVTVADTKD